VPGGAEKGPDSEEADAPSSDRTLVTEDGTVCRPPLLQVLFDAETVIQGMPVRVRIRARGREETGDPWAAIEFRPGSPFVTLLVSFGESPMTGVAAQTWYRLSLSGYQPGHGPHSVYALHPASESVEFPLLIGRAALWDAAGGCTIGSHAGVRITGRSGCIRLRIATYGLEGELARSEPLAIRVERVPPEDAPALESLEIRGLLTHVAEGLFQPVPCPEEVRAALAAWLGDFREGCYSDLVRLKLALTEVQLGLYPEAAGTLDSMARPSPAFVAVCRAALRTVLAGGTSEERRRLLSGQLRDVPELALWKRHL
jgi:hypothetical protein